MGARLVVTVPVLRSCEIDGRAYERGDLVSLAPIDAAIHARAGRVSLRRGPIVGMPEGSGVPDELAARADKKTYKRRDLRAES